MQRFTWITITLLLLSTLYVVSVFAEEKKVQVEKNEVFHPEYTLHGNIEFTADSYFGNYPVVTEANREGWVEKDEEYSAIKENFPMDNPTHPNLENEIKLNFEANLIPEMSLFIKPKYKQGIIWEQFYAIYNTERAFYTIGRFQAEMGAMGLLFSNEYSFDGIMINTAWKKALINVFFSQLDKTYYMGDSANFPYLSDSDDLIAGRVCWRKGDLTIGLNTIVDGFDDEKAITLDLEGKVGKHLIAGELGVVYPSRLNRNFIVEPDIEQKVDKDGDGIPETVVTTPGIQVAELEKGYYPGLVLSMNLVDSYKHLLRMTVGGMTKGFWSLYGTRVKCEIDDEVKFGRNLWGGELYYQYELGKNWSLACNLSVMEPIDREFFEKYQKYSTYPLRTAGIKLQKRISQSSEISTTVSYLSDSFFDYGKMTLKWKTRF